MSKPEKIDLAGLPPQRDKAGRLLPGHVNISPGRHKKPDLYALAAARRNAQGRDLADDLMAVVESLLIEARAGDVQAARLLFDKLSLPDAVVIKVQDELTDVERMERVRALIEAAETRRMLGNKPEEPDA